MKDKLPIRDKIRKLLGKEPLQGNTSINDFPIPKEAAKIKEVTRTKNKDNDDN